VPTLSALPEQPLPLSTVAVQRWTDGRVEQASDQVAEELPVALVYSGLPHVVMLATPSDLADLAVGFTRSEAIVASAAEILELRVLPAEGGMEVRIDIPGERLAALLHRQRNLSARTGCGLCGTESIEQAIRHPAPVGAGGAITSTELHAALADLHARQPLNAQSGSVHAAAWGLPGKGLQCVREDVGRHNALDKVLGALLRAGLDPANGYLVITSRASYEMVLKTATLGVTLLAAVSAPTGLAIRLAAETGVSLVGFARAHRHVVYAHPQRLLP
jgi:formate dehydrogenase accessory protein FdhD